MSLNTLIAAHRATLATSVVELSPALEAIPMAAVLSGDTVAALEDLTNAVGELAELESVIGGMEAIHTSLESHKTTPLTVREVQYLNLAVAGYVGKYGMTNALVPSIESAGGIDELVASTESRIGDMLAAAWKWVVDLWKRCKTFVLDFFDKLLSEAGRMKRRGKALTSAATKAKGTPTSPTIKVGRLANRLTVDGKLSEPEDCLDAVAKVLDLTCNVMGAIVDVTVYGAVQKMFGTSKSVEEIDKEITDLVRKVYEGVMKDGGWTGKEGNQRISEKLPDGTYFVATRADDETVTIERKNDTKDDGKDDADLAVSSPASLQKVGTDCEKLGNKTLELAAFARRKLNVKGLAEDMGEIVSATTTPPTPEEVEKLKATIGGMRKAIMALNANMRAVATMSRYCVSSAMAPLAVAEKMVGMYKEAPAK